MSLTVQLNPAHSRSDFRGYKLYSDARIQDHTRRLACAPLHNRQPLSDVSRAAAEAYGAHNHLLGVRWRRGAELLWWDRSGQLVAYDLQQVRKNWPC